MENSRTEGFLFPENHRKSMLGILGMIGTLRSNILSANRVGVKAPLFRNAMKDWLKLAKEQRTNYSPNIH